MNESYDNGRRRRASCSLGFDGEKKQGAGDGIMSMTVRAVVHGRRSKKKGLSTWAGSSSSLPKSNLCREKPQVVFFCPIPEKRRKMRSFGRRRFRASVPRPI